MYTHRGLSPFISFLPVLAFSRPGTARCTIGKCSALNSRVSNSLVKYALHFNSLVLHPCKPFRDDCQVAPTIREASTPDSLTLRNDPLTKKPFLVSLVFTVVAMNQQVRDFHGQHSSGGTLTLASNHWAMFGTTTSFNLPPFKCRPQHLLEQATILQGFSLLSDVDTQRAVNNSQGFRDRRTRSL